MVDARAIVDTVLVPHTAFQEALRRMTQCYAYAAAGGREPVCVALVGESRTGKSRCLEAFMSRYPRRRLADGIAAPILYVPVPSLPTVKSLAGLALKTIGADDWDKGTENALTVRLVKLIRECGVRNIILDEFQHFYDKKSHRVQHHVADWLKNLVGEAKAALTVAGLPSLQAVIDQNEQLAGRFTSPILMPRFDWLKDDDRSEWVAILGAYTEALNGHFDIPALDGDDLAFRMYCGTGGLMGYLSNTLRQATWNAIDAQTYTVTLADLQVAHRQAVWSLERFSHLPSPFDTTRLFYPSPDVVEAAKALGTPRAPAEFLPKHHKTLARIPGRHRTALNRSCSSLADV